MANIRRTVGWTLAVGSCLALADCWVTVRNIDGASERIGTMAVALGLYGAVLGSFGVLVGSVTAGVARFRAPSREPRTGSPRSLLASRVVATLAVVSAIAIALAGPEPARTTAEPGIGPSETRPNMILISIDTLRADHVGAYARGLETTPHLDQLAREGVLFETAYSTASWTLPAHASMLTGLDPFAHGAIHSRDRLDAAIETLPERLRGAGYRTEAWVGTDPHGYVGAAFGFAAGFEHYRHYPHPKRFRSSLIARMVDGEILRRFARDVGNATAEIDSVIRWLETSRSAPFFLFVHLYDVHSKTTRLPYEAPAPFRDRFCPGKIDRLEPCRDGRCASDRLLAMVERREARFRDEEIEILECLYDGGIAYVDAELGRLFRALDGEGLTQSTVVVVTSDHGEAFFEHGAPLHTTLHDEVTRVPLIVRAPGAAAGKRAAGVVSLADIAPTLLSLAGLEAPPTLRGQDLVTVLREWPAEARGDVLGVSLLHTLYREGEMKYIAHGLEEERRGNPSDRLPARDELYDLSEDASERVNRISFDGTTARRLGQTLAERRAESTAAHESLLRGRAVERVELSQTERERLRALGYLNEEDAPRD